MAVPRPMLTQFGIHYILESCVWLTGMVQASVQDFHHGKPQPKNIRVSPGNACCAKYSEILILLLEKLLVKRKDACAMKLRIQVQIFNAGNLEK